MLPGILFRPELKEYDFGPGHPFRGDRYESFPRYLKEKLPGGSYQILQAESATDEDLLLICQRDYIEFTREFYRAANLGLSYDGRFYDYHSMDNRPMGRPGKLEEAARLIVGQAKLAADLIQEGQYREVVSIGGGLHHAKRSYGEGFCLYNDVAFAGMYLLNKHKLTRVLILDTDAHAGNGTAEYFYAEPRVLFIDLHQDPRTLYPGTGFADEIGAGAGKGFTVNIPMPPGAGDESYRLAFEEIVEPLVQEFKPEIIVRNGGSDPYFADGLTNLGMTVGGFRMMGERVRKMAEVCGGRHIDLIASGYNEAMLPYAWMALLAGVVGFDITTEEPLPVPERRAEDHVIANTKAVITTVKAALKDYWRSFRSPV